MAITLRSTKGSELTHSELDGNFTDLDNRLNDAAGIAASAQVTATDANGKADAQALLIAALEERMTAIETLEDRISALEATLASQTPEPNP